eukprot:gb/GECG01016354.1/.p1 GENE.gb/GECG01016354.1/~~gb/GECG01016354.1/.p1  ORF type:complete len:1734 (+),score=205.00 gb/GECG01016354.1/:1-5202(+)
MRLVRMPSITLQIHACSKPSSEEGTAMDAMTLMLPAPCAIPQMEFPESFCRPIISSGPGPPPGTEESNADGGRILMHIKGICVFRLQFTEQDRLLRVVCWFWSGFSLVDHQNEQKMSQVRQRDLGVNMAHQSPPSGLQGSTGRTSRDRPQSMPAFPAHGLLPRQETKASEFLQQHPTYDGRGVTVAVLDTGVDPGASGLQTTSEGLRKVVDIVDCTGDGDVDMSRKYTEKDIKTLSVEESGRQTTVKTLPGVTGRWLKLNERWVNPSGEWRVGAKARNAILPTPVKKRLEKEQKKSHDSSVTGVVEDLEEQIRSIHEECPTIAAAKDKSKLSDTEASALSSKEELEQEIECVMQLNNKIEYNEPMFDCIVWHDGNQLVAGIDTSETGDFREISPMPSFEVSQDWRTMDSYSQVNYGVHFYDEGRTLSIVTDCGAHGTHVAGIIGGHWPQQPSLNGVAPGAQIVSLKIGDARLDSLETGGALLRAVQAIVDHKCQVANLSFGEPASVPNSGRFIEELQHALRKYGVIFVSSAGNDGPALTTVGAPAGTSDDLISVAAIITPSMMHAAYSVNAEKHANQLGHHALEDDDSAEDEGKATDVESLNDRVSEETVFDPQTGMKLVAMPFGWSSRGPCIDGYGGVTIAAPGGAITCVPRWTLKRVQLMNGTSMSSPNAAGCVALLVSGAIQEQLPATTPLIRRALVNSAGSLPAGDDWTTGAGMINVSGAWAQLEANFTALQEDVGKIDAFGIRANTVDVGYEFDDPLALGGPHGIAFSEPILDARVPYQGGGDGSSDDRGVYWREPWQSSSNRDVTAVVRVSWHDQYNTNDGKIEERSSLNQFKVNFMKHLRLETTAPWVTCPDHLVLSSDGRSFKFRINACELEEGKAHYAEIRAYYCKSESSVQGELDTVDGRGQVFSIPITIVKPVSARLLEDIDGEVNYRCNGGSPYEFSPGEVSRSFIECPEGATWAELVVERLFDPSDWSLNNASMSDPETNEFGRCSGRFTNRQQPDASALHDGGHPVDSTNSSHADSSPSVIISHLRQTVHNQSSKHNATREFRLMRKGEKQVTRVPIIEGKTLEITIGQFWSSFGTSHVNARVVFRGVRVEGGTSNSQLLDSEKAACTALNSPIYLDSSGMPCRVCLKSKLHRVTIDPAGELTHCQTSICPKSFSTSPLDRLRNGRQGRERWICPQELCLSYEYEVPGKPNGSPIEVKAGIHRIHGFDLLYDNMLDTSLVTVHDITNRQQSFPRDSTELEDFVLIGGVGEPVGTADVFMEGIKLYPGRKYRFDVRLSHPSSALLKHFTNAPLTVTRKLSSPIKISAYSSKDSAALAAASNKVTANASCIAKCGSNGSWSARKLQRHSCLVVMLGVPSPSALPAGVNTGDTLLGNVKFCRYENSDSSGSGKGCHPTGYPIVLPIGVMSKTPPLEYSSLPKYLPSEPSVQSGGEAAGSGVEAGKSKNPKEEAREQLREAGIESLRKLLSANNETAFESLYEIISSALEPEEGSTSEDRTAAVKQFLKRQLPLLKARLEYLEKSISKDASNLQKMWELANQILENLPVQDTLKYFTLTQKLPEGERRDRADRNPSGLTYEELSSIKNAIVHCLRKCCLCCCFETESVLKAEADASEHDRFFYYFDLLEEFVKMDGKENRAIYLEYLLRKGRWGSALKLLFAIINDMRQGTPHPECKLSSANRIFKMLRHLLTKVGALEVFETPLNRYQAYLRAVLLKKDKRA